MTSSKQQQRRRTQDLEVLYKISNIINTTVERQEVLKAVLKEVVRITEATSGSIAMLDRKRGLLIIETAINIPAQTWRRLKLQLGVGVTGWAAFKGEPVRLADVRRDSHYVAVKPDIRSELAVPMFLNGQVIGVINVDSTRRNHFSEADEKLLIAVAEQSARVIETARLYEKLKQHTAQMETLFGVGRDLASPAPSARIHDLAAREGRRLLEADVCLMVELSEDRTEMILRAVDGTLASLPEGGVAAVQPMRLAQSLLLPVVRRGKAVEVEDMKTRRAAWHGLLPAADGPASMLAVPMMYQQETQGILIVASDARRTFTENESKLLQLLANQTSVALENARRQDRILAMEDSLNRAERFSLLGTLAAEIAHEIRNPVTIINLLLDSVSEEMDANSQVKQDLTIVREKLDRIERIVDQTLNMAKSRDPQLEPVGVNALIRDILLFMNYKFAKARIEVKTSLEESLPDILADRGQIQQVFLNIILNAMQAMKGSGRLTIKTRREKDPEIGASVGIHFADNGIGVPKDAHSQLFEPFYTTRTEGTGLGLFVSRKIVLAHNGALRVQSREGKGSTFSILLPAGIRPDAAS